ncbi:predicted protein [Naegleria gruberi]|uniref:Predicted protein n=1 Tax=Naegleria gruberi TaxID=5762 RepID=D2VK05_NAEGR|nr:uncharacterized protein NAEGRDRAFT_50183 [Naegleria gruberi]EFC42864.1 predicted protein [Naegleria gruberi]|eukprot:XP_002675608.1 predicted protein [Naegleria gruberi strain NEG-M]
MSVVSEEAPVSVLPEESTTMLQSSSATTSIVTEEVPSTTTCEISDSTTVSIDNIPTRTTETTSSDSNIVVINVEGEGPANFLQRAIAVANKVYIYGGENSSGFWTNSLTILEGESNKRISWKKPRCFDFPPKTDSHSLVVFENNMIIFGGTDNQWINGGNNCIYCLDLEKLEWAVAPENADQDTTLVPQGRKQHSTAAVANKMYIFGGISSQVGSESVFNDVFVFDNETKLWSKVMVNGDSPTPRSGHTMVYNQQTDSLVIFGGKVGGSYSNEVWSLSLSELSWTSMSTTGNIPCGRENHSSVVCNDSMIIYGGWNIGGPKNDLYSLNLATFEWKKYSHNLETEKDSKRFGHASVYLDGSVLIFGGKNHLFNNQEAILKINMNNCAEVPVETEKPKEKKDIEEIILDLDEKDVVLYKNIFDQLTEENIKQYEELNTMLLKQKLFSAQVESLIESNRTLMAKEFTTPPSYTESSVPIIYSEVVETPQSYKDLMGQVFQPVVEQKQTELKEEGNNTDSNNEEIKEVEQKPKLPEDIPVIVDLPSIPESPHILEVAEEPMVEEKLENTNNIEDNKIENKEETTETATESNNQRDE